MRGVRYTGTRMRRRELCGGESGQSSSITKGVVALLIGIRSFSVDDTWDVRELHSVLYHSIVSSRNVKQEVGADSVNKVVMKRDLDQIALQFWAKLAMGTDCGRQRPI